jgi:hypothetical protein
VRLAVLATIARKGSHRSARLTFGSARGNASANSTLSIRPSGSVLTRLRAAAKNHQRISLSLTLSATASSRATAKATVGALKV